MLLILTKICSKITQNKVNISKQKTTSIYDIPYYVSSLKKIQKTCNWKPKIDLNKGLKQIYDWMKKNNNKIKKFF